MNRADNDRLDRVRGNLATYERVLGDPAAPFNAPEWAGVLAHNVKELLEMVDRMDAAPVPSGTGWPVP